MNTWRQLFVKDVLSIVRARELLVATFGFALLLVVVSSFSFRQVGYGQEELKSVTPGILWIIFLFSGVIGLNQTFLSEEKNGALLGVLLSRVEPALVYLSKMLSNAILLFALQFFVLFTHGLLFGAEIFSALPDLTLLALLASIGLSAVGTILSAVAVATRGREIVLPLLLFPLTVPLVAGLVFLSREVLFSGELSFSSFWFLLVVVFDLISLTLGLLLFEFVVWE